MTNVTILIQLHIFGVICCSIMPIKQVLEARPDMRLVAEYPSEGRLDIFSIRVFRCVVVDTVEGFLL